MKWLYHQVSCKVRKQAVSDVGGADADGEHATSIHCTGKWIIRIFIIIVVIIRIASKSPTVSEVRVTDLSLHR